MSDEFTTPLTVEQIYGDWDIEFDRAVELLDASLDPRPRTSLYDTFGDLGVGEGGEVLDIGGRDAAQALDLAERFGCRVLSVDPVPLNIADGTANIAAHPHGHLVENRLGTINDIPAPDDAFDAIFARDMLGHVDDLAGAFDECRRVLRAGGAMVVHEVFGTDFLEPEEAARLCRDLASPIEGLDVDRFERLVVEAGFTIEVTDRVGSEWLEATLEQETGEKRLLIAARLNRGRARLLDQLGEVPFRVLQANNLWTIYRMIGKLEDRVYVIRS